MSQTNLEKNEETTAMMEESKQEETALQAPADPHGQEDTPLAGKDDGNAAAAKKKKTLSLPRPKVQGEHVRVQMITDVNDIGDRDPHNINKFCKVTFEDIIAEPDPTVFSFDKVWTLSYKIFTTTKLWCYRITSVICAIPASICWGIYFACLAFNTIWCAVPALKGYEIECHIARRFYEIILGTVLGPLCDIVGRCFSHIVVTSKTG